MQRQAEYNADNVAWQYLPGPQQRALQAPVNELLLAGGRGWGKTEVQLMRFASNVQLGYGSYWRGILLDREYKNLDDLVVKSKRIFYPTFGDDVRFLSSNSDYKWVWSTGEELLFRQVKTDDDYWQYHGHEYPWLGWNELTKYPNGKLYFKMLSVNRTGFDPFLHTPKDENGEYLTWNKQPLPPIHLEVCSTTNPFGPGHNWVKSEFIDPAPYETIIRKTHRIFNPKTRKEEDITRTRTTVFGTYKDNPFLTPEYIAGLLEETDENIIKAWMNGDWDIVAGGALDDKWKKNVHIVPRFKVPENWYVDRALDWGSSHPFSVGWFAEANGEEVELPDGTVICPAPGTIIQIAEWYGTKKLGTNTGLKLSAKDVAKGIIEIEQQLLKDEWITRKPAPGPADNQIANVVDSGQDTIEKMMADLGVVWEKSDKSAGTRKQGLQLIRDRLEASTRKEGEGLLFMDNCRASIATIPVLPRDAKDMDVVDTDAEDHPYDMLRYRVLKGNNRTAKVIRVSFAR